MHILTGMIVAALMGKKKQGPGVSPLLGPSSPVRLSHSVPGRSRFHVEALKRAHTKCRDLSSKLRQIEGLGSVVADPRTGSLLVHHDPERIPTDLLAAAVVRLLGLEDQLGRAPQPALARQVRRVGGALNSAVYAKTGGLVDLWTLVPLVLLVFGVRKIIADRTTMMPTGLTLVWWAYSSLFRGGGASQ